MYAGLVSRDTTFVLDSLSQDVCIVNSLGQQRVALARAKDGQLTAH